MTEALEAGGAEWSRKLFDSLHEGMAWGVPRSGLIFRRRGEQLELTHRMPHDPRMPMSAEQLREYQESDVDVITRHFAAAGVTVVDRTREKADG